MLDDKLQILQVKKGLLKDIRHPDDTRIACSGCGGRILLNRNAVAFELDDDDCYYCGHWSPGYWNYCHPNCFRNLYVKLENYYTEQMRLLKVGI